MKLLLIMVVVLLLVAAVGLSSVFAGGNGKIPPLPEAALGVVGGATLALQLDQKGMVRGAVFNRNPSPCLVTIADQIATSKDGQIWEVIDSLPENGLSVAMWGEGVVERIIHLPTGRTELTVNVPTIEFLPVNSIIELTVGDMAVRAVPHRFIEYQLMIKSSLCETLVPRVELLSTSIAGLSCPSPELCPQEAEGRILFNLTALGGDAYVAQADVDATGGVGFTSFLKSDAEVVGESGIFLVRAGETRWFEVNGHLANTGEEAVFTKMVVSGIRWGTSLDKPEANMLEVDFETAEILLHPSGKG